MEFQQENKSFSQDNNVSKYMRASKYLGVFKEEPVVPFGWFREVMRNIIG